MFICYERCAIYVREHLPAVKRITLLQVLDDEMFDQLVAMGISAKSKLVAACEQFDSDVTNDNILITARHYAEYFAGCKVPSELLDVCKQRVLDGTIVSQLVQTIVAAVIAANIGALVKRTNSDSNASTSNKKQKHSG